MPPDPPHATGDARWRQRVAEVARAGGAAALAHFRRPLTVDDKRGRGALDPVTAADREAEQAMRALIERHHPGHGIVGEEFGETRPESPWRWLLDPIDGTRGYICGLPTWGTLVGLLQNGRPVAGAMYQPWVEELYLGGDGESSVHDRHGTRRLTTRRCSRPTEAVVCCTDPAMFAPGEELRAFQRIAAAARLVRYGTDCYGYCALAMGLVDVVIEADLKPFDILPLVPIIEGAGGVVTDWRGGPPGRSSQALACGDPALHARLLPILADGAR